VPGDLHLTPQHQLPSAHCVSSCFSHAPSLCSCWPITESAWGCYSWLASGKFCMLTQACIMCGGHMAKSTRMDPLMVVTMAGSHLHHLCNAMCVHIKIS
jgi:hypothetical protein